MKDLLDVPENIRVVALTPLGYPNREPSSKRGGKTNEGCGSIRKAKNSYLEKLKKQ